MNRAEREWQLLQEKRVLLIGEKLNELNTYEFTFHNDEERSHSENLKRILTRFLSEPNESNWKEIISVRGM